MKTREINLRVEYSDPELAEKRDELSNVVLGAHEVESQKSAVNKGFKEQLEALYSRRDVLAHQIKARGETRPVLCAVEFNKPVDGIKRIVRMDTGELVADEPMTEDERQQKLFVDQESLEKIFSAPDERNPKAEMPPIPPPPPDEPPTDGKSAGAND